MNQDQLGLKSQINILDSAFLTGKLNFKKKKSNDERDAWGGQLGFFLASLGYTIGLSCVWRFPTLAYYDGGGAFLIPFIIFSLLLGIPLVFLELSVGQYTSTGILSCWTMAKVFRGVGIAMNFSNAYVCIYYNMIIAYTIYYLFMSFTSELPWKYCNPSWASLNCVDNYDPSVFNFTTCDNSTHFELSKCDNGKCFNITMLNIKKNMSLIYNESYCNLTNNSAFVGWWNPEFPSQDYWNKVVLQKSTGFLDFNGIVWQLILCLFAAWCITFLLIIKGVESSGKVVYFTTIYPYVVLLILGIQGWTLDGASLGIHYYITPDLSRLTNIGIWFDAAVQVFFTLSVSYGGLLTYASFNKFDAPILRHSIILTILSCMTSIFCGFVVFPYIGYLAKHTGQDIQNVIQSDAGLAFIVFPYAAATLSASPFWSILFFSMVLAIGVDNMMASTETAVTAISDLIPLLKKTNLRKILTTAGVCFFFFLCGIVFCTRAGTYWIHLFDNYSGGWSVLFTASVECLSVAFFYGFDNYRGDIFVMIGHKVAYSKFFNIFKYCWLLICPPILIFLIIYSFVTFTPLTSDDGYVYPKSGDIIGNLMCTATALGIVLYAIYAIIDNRKKHKPWKNLIEPGPSWLPMRLPDRIFANVVKIEEKYTKFDDEREIKEYKEKKMLESNKLFINESNLPVEVVTVNLDYAKNKLEPLDPLNEDFDSITKI